jgi:hypothetical protein
MSMKTKAPVQVPQLHYKWGARLPAGMAPKKKSFHTTDIYAGMVRFKTSAGGAKSSAYLTFRVMMEGSPKWIMPARPGLFIVQKIRDEIAAEAPKVFAAAVAAIK